MSTPTAVALRDLLTAEGAAVHAEGDQLDVTGLTADRIGEIAQEHTIPLRQLSTRSASLKDVFMALTADSAQYLAGESR